jgi:hypothetical protein
MITSHIGIDLIPEMRSNFGSRGGARILSITSTLGTIEECSGLDDSTTIFPSSFFVTTVSMVVGI